MRSALYHGTVVHRRLRPKPHRLRYRVFSLLLDLDDLPRLGRDVKRLVHNRFGLFSFHDRDHGPGDGSLLRPWVEDTLRAAGISEPPARVAILTYPRILGYVFNPLSVYFCHDAADRVTAVLYEVSNTFRERHTYVIPTEGGGRIRQECDKRMYVSPFIGMRATYRFHLRPPDAAVTVGIRQSDPQGPLLNAVFSGRREDLSDAALRRAFLRYPLMTFKVIAGIHWEALLLWRKGAPVHRHETAPAVPFSVGRSVSPAIEDSGP